MTRLVALVALVVATAQPTPARAEVGQPLGAAYRAFAAGDFATALALGRKIDRRRAANPDYVAYLVAQAAYLTGDYATARAEWQRLAGMKTSRFHELAPWRVADCAWQAGDVQAAAAAYAKLLAHAGASAPVDPAIAELRVAEAAARAGQPRDAIAGFTALRTRHPTHPLEPLAIRRLRELGGVAAATLTDEQRVARARVLVPAEGWDDALRELEHVADDVAPALRRERDFWTGMALFHMRRQYLRASTLLLAIYPAMGDRAAEALFHGARALSRADKDEDAVGYYQTLVKTYPRAPQAAEAQFLSGWLYFNLGKYEAGLPYLEDTLRRYGKTKFGDDALWYLGFSHFLLGHLDQALARFAELAKHEARLEGGKGAYWHARTLAALHRDGDATAEYRALVGRYPFSWYAALARARLAAGGVTIDPFGDAPRDPARDPPIERAASPKLLEDPLLVEARELLDAGLGGEAGRHLRRGEKAFVKRHPRAAALAALLDTYRTAGDFNRPWEIAESNEGGALDAAPTGRGRIWWEHAFPLAYRPFIERWRDLGKNPPYYLYSIMRKESGYDPHDHSYADAIGLLQMIPQTTRRVCVAIGIPYTDDLLFQPELNIRTGSWYIGKLLQKFRTQIPIGAGSFNCGPRPVMKWIDQFGDRPIDEFVELVPYQQTREYMKKLTEIYARYLYLYEHAIYDQPLAVDRNYVKDDLTY